MYIKQSTGRPWRMRAWPWAWLRGMLRGPRVARGRCMGRCTQMLHVANFWNRLAQYGFGQNANLGKFYAHLKKHSSSEFTSMRIQSRNADHTRAMGSVSQKVQGMDVFFSK